MRRRIALPFLLATLVPGPSLAEETLFMRLESGLTAAWLGTVPAVVIGGIGTVLVTVIWAFLFPQLRDVDRPEDHDAPADRVKSSAPAPG